MLAKARRCRAGATLATWCRISVYPRGHATIAIAKENGDFAAIHCIAFGIGSNGNVVGKAIVWVGASVGNFARPIVSGIYHLAQEN